MEMKMQFAFFEVGQTKPSGRYSSFEHFGNCLLQRLDKSLQNYTEKEVYERVDIFTDHESEDFDEVVLVDGDIVGSINLPISQEQATKLKQEMQK